MNKEAAWEKYKINPARKFTPQEIFNAGWDAGLERAAEIAALHVEYIKHTSHRDGLGMGSLCCEAEVGFVKDAIKKEITK